VTAVRQVVLVGAGHSHVEVLRQWALQPPPHAELVLVIDRNPAVYSGMVPGFVAGQYSTCDLEIDGIALARKAGARVLVEPATVITTTARSIRIASGETIPYDWASLDVGSTVVGLGLPGVAEHALPARPIQRLIAGADELVRRARALPRDERFRLSIVGAGAGGVELALCFESRLRREVGRRAAVALLDRSEAPLSGAPSALVRRVSRALARRGLQFHGGVDVTALDGASAVLADGTRIEADAVVWVPGPAAHAFLSEGDLPLDRRGFVRIRPTLQVEGADRLFAVGDCASLTGMQKAGVYAVRSGPILVDNLRRALAGRPLRSYDPQREFLSLLNLGDGTALGIKRGLTFEGRWVMRLKDRIDRRFMERYP
jgi:selenide,water dikinase